MSGAPGPIRRRRAVAGSSYGFHELKGVSEPETYARESLQRIIDLYEAWDAAEPGEGYDAKAAEWRALFTAQEAEEAN